MEIQDLRAGYGEIQVLWGVDLAVRSGEITALIGSNGAGKTTLMRALSGLIPLECNSYRSDGIDLVGATASQIIARGIVHVPEGRRLFGAMSVEDNLLMGAYSRDVGRAEVRRDLDHVYTTFPKLRERRDQAAATLSGGEQQMCAIGRGLMADPRLMMCDEISLGLAPIVIRDIYAALPAIKAEGASIVIVEQDIQQALAVSDRVYCFQEGRMKLTGKPSELTREAIHTAYFGT